MPPVDIDKIIELHMALIRQEVRRRLKLGDALSDLAAVIHMQGEKVGVSVALRKAVRSETPDPKLNEAIVRAMAATDERLPIVVALPIAGAVAWLDYEAFEQSAN